MPKNENGAKNIYTSTNLLVYMTRLFPALNFLYLHNSAVDLYLKTLREAVQSIPEGILQLEYNCLPIITDYSDSRETENTGIILGYGFHPCDFEALSHPLNGLVFCLNPPYVSGINKVRMHHTQHGKGVIPIRSSFMMGKHRFLLTDQEFNLDNVVCGEIRTGEIYKKLEHYKPDPNDPDACLF